MTVEAFSAILVAINTKRNFRKLNNTYVTFRHILVAIFCFMVLLNACKEDDPETIVPDTPEQKPQDVFTNGSVVKYHDNGDQNNRINMVFIGDGFAQADQQKWKDHVDDMLEALFSSSLGEPFGRYKKFFNVYRIDMISKHSGLDALNRNTPLRGMVECLDWRAGDCQTDWTRTHDAIDHYMKEIGNPEVNLRMVALHSSQHLGGAHYPERGFLNIYSTDHSKSVNIFLHETGHIAGALADEYVTNREGSYSGSEPSQANVTTVLNPLKWQHWVGFEQPYTLNGSPVIGTFEGAMYVGKGIYRASEQCMMNGYVNPFCAICREKLILDFYRKVRPVDQVTVSMPTITVDLVDPELFHVSWFVNDIEVDNSSLTLDMSTLGLESGNHTVNIKVADKILDYSHTGEEFDWVRKDTNLLIQEITRVVSL